MNFQNWIENVEGLASIYAFDILPDGSFSEIRLMAFNQQNEFMTKMTPDAPKFYSGIPYRNYFMDLNFESFVYKCASSHQPLYSYVNARGVWLKGFYLPITEPGTISAAVTASRPEQTEKQTVYCLYIATYSQEVEADSMSQHSSEVAAAVMNISLKLHETQNFHQAMAAVVGEIKKVCGADKCALYTVDVSNQHCNVINEQGVETEKLEMFASEMNKTPYEIALQWEQDLALSDCLLLEDLSTIAERDPLWYQSLLKHELRNIILYAVRFNQALVGYIWAADFDTAKMLQIKETLVLTAFLIGAAIANHQLVSRLQVMSTIDGLTQVSNRNAMNERVSRLIDGADPLPASMGVVYADLNGLKTVNDMGGHDAGDKLLRRAAALLKLAFGDHEIYRAGGDEFVAFCPEITEEALAQLVSQLRGLIDNTPDVSFAVGTSWVNGDYDICRAMQLADERMYQDKEAYYRRHPEIERRKNH